MIRAEMRVMAPTFCRPYKWRGGEHSVEVVDGCIVRQKHSNGFHAPGHGRPMQGRDPILVFCVRVKTAGEHCLEDFRFSKLGRCVRQEVMFDTQFVPQTRLRQQHFAGALAVSRSAGGDKPVEQ
jgi:hypothetical protein